jgi:succinate dehydrogenase/fumarate reductase flavoprotein subunit
MREDILTVRRSDGAEVTLPVTWVHTLVIGSGAAGLNAAVQTHNQGIEDLLILTEGLQMGTSINTGSDKQTYYKLALYGAEADSPAMMAESYFAGGSMHGDLALIEASLSARAFLNLVNLGVPFPQDQYGQFVGYKTDHDPRQRATSVGPYTSREMCRALIRELERDNIPIREGRVVVALLTVDEEGGKRIAGALALDERAGLEVYAAENVILATGGPGGLYKTSVYPQVHTGSIGLALMAGAKAQSLPESQYGLASIKFRWNVSGTFMQVIPRFISTAADGQSDEREFLGEYFDSAAQMHSLIFLKGYQWPFDARKIVGGSSLIDILVYIETVQRGRRVFLDFRRNPTGFRFDMLSVEAQDYLARSQALQETPIARLQAMNPAAIQLYAEHGIVITTEPLEIAVCVQHNNGGLAGNIWWESTNIKHLFPVGEVNGSHGVYRPGGSALNAGQVGGLRAAGFIAHRYKGWTLDEKRFQEAAVWGAVEVLNWVQKCAKAEVTWQDDRAAFQARMSRAGAHIRSLAGLRQAAAEAREQWARLEAAGCRYDSPDALREALRNRQLCLAHRVYLEAILFAAESGVGSRGSSMVVDPQGTRVHAKLSDDWRFAPEDMTYRDKVLETWLSPRGESVNAWVERRPLPHTDAWFETAWAAFRSGAIYAS